VIRSIERTWREWDTEVSAFVCSCGLSRYAVTSRLDVVQSCGHALAAVTPEGALAKAMPPEWLANYATLMGDV
jgi:hypothetical protein